MKGKRVLFAILFAALFFVLFLTASAEGGEVWIQGHNLKLTDHVSMIYYVGGEDLPDGAALGVAVYRSQKAAYTKATADTLLETAGGTEAGFSKFYYEGLADYEMTDTLWARPYYTDGGNIVYGALDSYSVLQYAMEQTGKTGYVPNASLAATLEWLLSEGAKAQIAEGYKTNCLPTGNFGYLSAEGAVLPDGVSGNGCFALGDEVTLTGKGGVMGWYQDGVRVGSGHTLAVIVTAEPQSYSAVCEEHDFEAVLVTPATCTEAATYRLVCACGETSGEPYASGEALGHAEVIDAAVAATCIGSGLTEGKHCSRCEAILIAQTVVPALGHNWNDGEITTAPTCTAAGVRTYTCTRCGATDTEEVAASGHNYEEIVTAPTCTEGGYTTHTCSGCGDSYTDSATSALGHNWNDGEITTAPTCTAAGVRTYTCTRCGATDTEEVAASGHNYEEIVTAPTCTEGGYTTHTCSGCGDSYADSATSALGHNWNDGEITTAPTCTAAGVRTYTCTRCGATDTEEIAALGHDYGYNTGYCSHCGDGNVIYASNGDGTCKVVGLKSKTYDDVYVVIAETSPDGDRVTSIAENAFVGSYVEEIVIPKSVTTIETNAFYDVMIMAVYYGGSRALWDSIVFEEGNGTAYFADVYCYTPTKPAANGNLWHWVDGVLTIWPPNTDDYGELHPTH